LGGHDGAVHAVDFSPDGQRLLTAAADRKVIVWQLDESRREAVFRGHQSAVTDAVFSPDGRVVASGDEEGALLVWRPGELEEDVAHISRLLNDEERQAPERGASFRSLAGHRESVRCVRFAADGRHLLSSGHDNTVRWWDLSAEPGVECLRTLRGHGGWVRACRFAKSGAYAVSGAYDQQIKYWQLDAYAEQQTLSGHADAVLSAEFSPDGQRVVTAGRDHTARIWDLASGTSHVLDEGHDYLMMNAVFLPDGAQILTAAFDNTVLKWDCRSRGQVAFATASRLKGAGRNGVLAVSPDGRWLLTAGDEFTAKVWNVATGDLAQVLRGHRDTVTAVAFAPGGLLAFSGDAAGSCLLWRRPAESEPWQLAHTLRGHRAGMSIQAACFTPDARRLLTASADHTVAQWDVATGRESQDLVLGHPDSVTRLALSPDGRLALTACADRIARLWDVRTARSRVLDSGEGRPRFEQIDGLAFSPDGRRAVVLWGDARLAHVFTWPAPPSLDTPATRRALRGDLAAARSAEFSPDGRQLLTAGGDQAYLWSIDQELARVASFRPHGAVASASFSPDGRYVVTAGQKGAVKVWDTTASAATVVLKWDAAHGGRPVRSAVFSPRVADGAPWHVLTAGDDAVARLWEVDVDAGEPRCVASFAGHGGPLNQAKFSPDAQWIVTASDDGTAAIWNVAQGEDQQPIVLRGHSRAVLSATFAPGSAVDASRDMVVTGSDDNRALVWSLDYEQRTASIWSELSGGHTSGITSVACSPDGRRVLTGGRDHLTRLWITEPGTSREVLTLTYHQGEVTAVAFSPQGDQVITAGEDGAAVVWPSQP
jgi:WD40 repeat protein